MSREVQAAAAACPRVDARFCPACGGPLEAQARHGHERQVCARCGRVHYRNSKPAVSAIVLRRGEVLLSRRAREPKRDQWDLPGGFLEAGEPPEAGLARELREETSMAVGSPRLVDVAIGDYAGEPTLNLIYVCEAEGTPVAADDSAELRWWPLDALPRDLAWEHERRALGTIAQQLTRPQE